MGLGSCADCGRVLNTASMQLCKRCATQRDVCMRCLRPGKAPICEECKEKPVLWGGERKKRPRSH